MPDFNRSLNALRDALIESVAIHEGWEESAIALVDEAIMPVLQVDHRTPDRGLLAQIESLREGWPSDHPVIDTVNKAIAMIRQHQAEQPDDDYELAKSRRHEKGGIDIDELIPEQPVGLSVFSSPLRNYGQSATPVYYSDEAVIRIVDVLVNCGIVPLDKWEYALSTAASVTTKTQEPQDATDKPDLYTSESERERGDYWKGRAFDLEEVMADHRRLVRELDVALNGEEGAAEQASLCDIVAQVKAMKRQPEREIEQSR